MAGEATTSERPAEPAATGLPSKDDDRAEDVEAGQGKHSDRDQSEVESDDGGAPVLPRPSAAEQRQQYELAEGRVADDKEGDAFFVVPQKWFEQWGEHVGMNQPVVSACVGGEQELR